jgi:hypothetical protein
VVNTPPTPGHHGYVMTRQVAPWQIVRISAGCDGDDDATNSNDVVKCKQPRKCKRPNQ